MKKAIIDVALGMVAILALILILMVSVNVYTTVDKFIDLGREIDILVEISDETSKFFTVLDTRTPDLNVMDFIAFKASENSGAEADYNENKITEIADRFDTAIILYDENGNVKKTYGKRKLGHVVKTDIPVSGGKVGKIGILLDVEIPEKGGA